MPGISGRRGGRSAVSCGLPKSTRPAASYFRRADEAERNGVKSFHPLPNFFKPVEEEEAENTKKLALLIKTKNDKVLKKRMKEAGFLGPYGLGVLFDR